MPGGSQRIGFAGDMAGGNNHPFWKQQCGVVRLWKTRDGLSRRVAVESVGKRRCFRQGSTRRARSTFITEHEEQISVKGVRLRTPTRRFGGEKSRWKRLSLFFGSANGTRSGPGGVRRRHAAGHPLKRRPNRPPRSNPAATETPAAAPPRLRPLPPAIHWEAVRSRGTLRCAGNQSVPGFRLHQPRYQW